MPDPHQDAQRRVFHCLVASLIARPLEPGLTDAELQDAVVSSGISLAIYKEISRSIGFDKDSSGRRFIGSGDLLLMLSVGEGDYPIELFPSVPIAALAKAFERLDLQYGKTYPKALPILVSECSPEPQHSIELALGMAIALGIAAKENEGYVLRSDFDDLLAQPRRREAHPWVTPIQTLVPIVQAIVARRTGTLVPSLSPIDQFHRFLVRQNWGEFATWWALTSREMESASQFHPTATTLLAAALLEAALVAIAEPSVADKAWNRDFLKKPPETWKLGQLIDQAEAAGTFNSTEAALAKTLADIRNRIHAGRFSTAGAGPFRPPSTNTHEAQLAKLNLQRLIDVILGWAPALNRS